MEALARALSDWTQLLGPAAVDGDTTFRPGICEYQDE